MLTVVPERGLQVRAVSRGNFSQLDPREMPLGLAPRPARCARLRLLQAIGRWRWRSPLILG